MTYWLKNFAKKTKINKIKSQRRRIWDKSQRKKCGFEPNPNAEEFVPQKARVFIENQVIQEAEDISRPNRFFKFGRSIFCFVHPIFRFCFLVTFGDEVTKILCNLCLHFARQDGQDRKRKENHATEVTKIPKTKKRK